jgi:hypothetical protein
MIGVLQSVYKACGKTLNVTDLADAVKNLSQAEVTKKFVEGMSFMLSTTLGTGKSTSGSIARPAKRTTQPLWDPKQLAVGQHFSQAAYLCVQKIESNTITVLNSFGNHMIVSKDLLENMDSADHFTKEVPLSMTELVEILETAQDTIFTVKFKK